MNVSGLKTRKGNDPKIKGNCIFYTAIQMEFFVITSCFKVIRGFRFN